MTSFSGKSKEKAIQPGLPGVTVSAAQARLLQAGKTLPHPQPSCLWLPVQKEPRPACPKQGEGEGKDGSILAGSEWPYPNGDNQ